MQSRSIGMPRISAISAADLRARQQPADTRLCALTQLDLDRANLRRARDRVLQSRHAEATVRFATTEVPGADLPHQIAALQVVRRHAAFARALQATGNLAAAIERLHGRPAQRPEAHARHVDDRCRPERPRPPRGAAHHFRARNPELRIELRIARMIGRQRKGVVLDDQVVRLQLHLVVGAEAEVVVLAFGRRVDPSPLVAAERTLLVVVGDDVLAELGTDRFQPVAEVSDDRERPEDRVLTLRQIVDRHGDHDPDRNGDHPHRHESRRPRRSGRSAGVFVDRALVRHPPAIDMTARVPSPPVISRALILTHSSDRVVLIAGPGRP